MPSECYLQAAFVAPSACTIRVTVTDGVTPDTADWSIAAGDRFASLDAMLSAWNAAMASDFAVGQCTAEHRSVAPEMLRLTSTYGTIAVAWSHAGDGAAVREWLGWTGDVAAGTSPRNAPAAHTGGLYLTEPPEVTVQTSRRRARSQRRLLGGQTETQHDTTPSAWDDGPVSLVLRLASWTEVGTLRDWIPEVLDGGETGADGRFTVFWDGGAESLTVRFAANPVEVVVEPVSVEADRQLFRAALAVERAG